MKKKDLGIVQLAPCSTPSLDFQKVPSSHDFWKAFSGLLEVA